MRKLTATTVFTDSKGNIVDSFIISNEVLNKKSNTKTFQRLPEFIDHVKVHLDDAIRFLRAQEETLKKFPRRLWIDGIPDTRALEGGLMSVENEKLTMAGLVDKMIEWQRREGRVDRYVYDLTKKALNAKGLPMPATIKRGK